jgi:AcrR family transcriptional regulator
VEEGLRALGDGGLDAVRVESLAQAIGVTKGGFYWHFADRGALLDEVLDAWERVTCRVDNRRMDYLRGLFGALGGNEADWMRGASWRCRCGSATTSWPPTTRAAAARRCWSGPLGCWRPSSASALTNGDGSDARRAAGRPRLAVPHAPLVSRASADRSGFRMRKVRQQMNVTL